MYLFRQLKQCSPQVDGVPLKQSEKFRYLGISFTSGGKQNSELGMNKYSIALALPISGTGTSISLCSYSDLWPLVLDHE